MPIPCAETFIPAPNTVESFTGRTVVQALPKAVSSSSRASSSRSPLHPAAQQLASPSAGSLMHSLVSVQPHALDSHVPALCGPLQASHAAPFSPPAHADTIHFPTYTLL